MITERTNPFERLFEDALGRRRTVAMDVVESEKGYTVILDVPGFTMEDIEVTALGDEVRFKGERRLQEPAEGERHHLRGRSALRFDEVVRFPVPVAVDSIEASLADGVLSVRIPKAQAALPRRIELKKTNG